MSHIAYVNGRYLPHREAAVHIEDRGFQFADGVYEVCGIRDGKLIDETRHLDRLERSLAELRIPMPVARAALDCLLRETIRRNRVRDGIVYLQVTRGVAPRDHAFPDFLRPSIVITAKRSDPAKLEKARTGVAVVTRPDERWARRDIKSVSLLPNILAKQSAREAGAYEALLVDGEGFVTEGSSTNVWLVDAGGRLVTRPLGPEILNGVTRQVLVEAAKAEGIELVERPFTVEEAAKAAEMFLSASSVPVIPVIRLDGKPVGEGKPGPVGARLRAAYWRLAELN
ncbi:D-alanine transaminase [Parvibaculum indicum]|uniref:D-amino-acid transaminase n=1 Tax=Parvibaculum indicum TaxID=562969 RepID=UPI00141E9602|nr:D-amino-acid transaminase [Parvibaculum indicum]NIJ42771.1 D-alanine transaminase [Parvibaculum indicum]